MSAATIVLNVCLVLVAALASGAEGKSRFVKRFQIPGSSAVVMVAEGDFEPRSVGSYTLRVYGGRSEKFPTDDFIAGVVRPRNGVIEAVRFDDVDGDDKPEIVVTIRTVGSGGYISADAFRYQNGSLEFTASVSDLDKEADPIQVLRGKFNAPTADRTSPHS